MSANGGQQIESMYVSFGGDGTGYEKMLDESVVATTQASSDMVKILSTAADQIEKEFKSQAKTFSMTAREADIFRLQLAGATDEQLKGARAANDALTALEKEQAEFEKFSNLQAEVKSFTSALELQSRTFNGTARQVDIYRLAMQGASKADIQALVALDRKLTRQEKVNSLMVMGKNVTREMGTATERFSIRQKELNDMLAVGAINATTYKLAMDDAKKRIGTGWDRIAEAINPVNSAIMTVGKSIQQVGRSYSMYITAPIMAFGALAVNEFGKFDDGMVGAFAIMGNIDDVVKNKLTKSVRELAASGNTMFTPEQLSGGLKGLAAAGLDAEQSIGSLGVVERFATAGAFGLDRATQLLLDSQSALGLVEKDAIKNKENLLKVSDALIKAGDQSTASPEQFAEALANGAADARNFGMELTTIMAVLDAYASKGNKGAAAGSDLARATRLISKAVRENGEVFKTLGIKPVDELTGEYKNFIDIVGDMENAFKGLTGPEKSAMLELMGFEALAQSAILPLIGMSQQMRIWEMEQKNATDYTKNVAEKQMGSFAKQMQALWSKLKEAGVGIGEIVAPAIKFMSNQLATTLDLWRALPGPVQATVVGMAAVVAVGGPLIFVLGSGVVAAGAFSTALTTLGVSATAASIGMRALALATPLGLILAAAAAGYALGSWLDSFDIQLTDNIATGGHWNKMLRESIALHDELADKMAGINSNRARKAIKETEGMNEGDKRQFLMNNLETEQKNVQGLSSQVTGARKRVEELSTTWNTMVGSKILVTAQQEVKEVEKNLEEARKRASLFKEELDKMGSAGEAGPGKVNNAIKPLDIELQELTNKLQEQIDTFKQSSEEAKIHELRMAGMTDAQLKNVIALNEQLKAKKANQKQSEMMSKFDEELKRLKAEEAMFGKGSRAIEIYRMKLDGASSAHIAQAEAIDANLTKLENEKKAREKIASFKDDIITLEAQIATFGKGARAIDIYKMKLNGASDAQIKAAMDMDVTLTALEKHKKAQEKATEVTKKHAPPMQRYVAEQKELQDLLDQGLISLDTYKNALNEVWKETAKDFTVNFKVGGVDGVAAGSAEAIARIQEYLAMRGQMDNPDASKKRPVSSPIPDFTNGMVTGDFKGTKSKGGLTPLQQKQRERVLGRKKQKKDAESLAGLTDTAWQPPTDLGLGIEPIEMPTFENEGWASTSPSVAMPETPKPFDLSQFKDTIPGVQPSPQSAESAVDNSTVRSDKYDNSPSITAGLNAILERIEQNTRPDSSKPVLIVRQK